MFLEGGSHTCRPLQKGYEEGTTSRNSAVWPVVLTLRVANVMDEFGVWEIKH